MPDEPAQSERYRLWPINGRILTSADEAASGAQRSFRARASSEPSRGHLVASSKGKTLRAST
jgi:hypothetical protein